MPVLHLDTDVMIALADKNDEWHRSAHEFMNEIQLVDDMLIAVSAIAWTEFIRSPKEGRRGPLEEFSVRQFLNGNIVQFGEDQADKAADYYRL